MCIYSIRVSIIWISDSTGGFFFGFSLQDIGEDKESESTDEQGPEPSEKGELTLLSKHQNTSTSLFSPLLFF